MRRARLPAAVWASVSAVLLTGMLGAGSVDAQAPRLPEDAAADWPGEGLPNWIAGLRDMLTGLAVQTRQHAGTAAQNAAASSEAALATAHAAVEVDRRFMVQDAYRRQESMQAATAGLCVDVAGAGDAGRAGDVVADIRAALVQREVDWVTEGGARADVLVATGQARAAAFCPPGEAALGLCEDDHGMHVGGFQAADSSTAPFLLRSQFGARAYGAAEAEAGLIYMDTLLPPATIAAQAEAAAAGTAARLERVRARREQALVSLGRAATADVVLRGLEGGIGE